MKPQKFKRYEARAEVARAVFLKKKIWTTVYASFLK